MAEPPKFIPVNPRNTGRRVTYSGSNARRQTDTTNDGGWSFDQFRMDQDTIRKSWLGEVDTSNSAAPLPRWTTQYTQEYKNREAVAAKEAETRRIEQERLAKEAEKAKRKAEREASWKASFELDAMGGPPMTGDDAMTFQKKDELLDTIYGDNRRYFQTSLEKGATDVATAVLDSPNTLVWRVLEKVDKWSTDFWNWATGSNLQSNLEPTIYAQFAKWAGKDPTQAYGDNPIIEKLKAHSAKLAAERAALDITGGGATKLAGDLVENLPTQLMWLIGTAAGIPLGPMVSISRSIGEVDPLTGTDIEFIHGAVSGAIEAAVESVADLWGFARAPARNLAKTGAKAVSKPFIKRAYQAVEEPASWIIKKSVGKAPVIQILAHMIHAGGGEAAEEILEFPFQQFLEWRLLNPNAPASEYYNAQKLGDWAYGGIAGFAGGALLGSISGLHSVANEQARSIITDRITKIAAMPVEETFKEVSHIMTTADMLVEAIVNPSADMDDVAIRSQMREASGGEPIVGSDLEQTPEMAEFTQNVPKFDVEAPAPVAGAPAEAREAPRTPESTNTPTSTVESAVPPSPPLREASKAEPTAGVIKKRTGTESEQIKRQMSTLEKAVVSAKKNGRPARFITSLQNAVEIRKNMLREVEAYTPPVVEQTEPDVEPAGELTPEQLTAIKAVQDYIRDKNPNVRQGRIALERLEDILGDDARDYLYDADAALEEYDNAERSDYDSAEDYREARHDLWDEFVDYILDIGVDENIEAPAPVSAQAVTVVPTEVQAPAEPEVAPAVAEPEAKAEAKPEPKKTIKKQSVKRVMERPAREGDLYPEAAVIRDAEPNEELTEKAPPYGVRPATFHIASIGEDGKQVFRPVAGGTLVKVNSPNPTYHFFALKTDNGWQVSIAEFGLLVARGATKAKAIEAANATLSRYSREQFDGLVEKFIKDDTWSPWVEEYATEQRLIEVSKSRGVTKDLYLPPKPKAEEKRSPAAGTRAFGALPVEAPPTPKPEPKVEAPKKTVKKAEPKPVAKATPAKTPTTSHILYPGIEVTVSKRASDGTYVATEVWTKRHFAGAKTAEQALQVVRNTIGRIEERRRFEEKIAFAKSEAESKPAPKKTVKKSVETVPNAPVVEVAPGITAVVRKKAPKPTKAEIDASYTGLYEVARNASTADERTTAIEKYIDEHPEVLDNLEERLSKDDTEVTKAIGSVMLNLRKMGERLRSKKGAFSLWGSKRSSSPDPDIDAEADAILMKKYFQRKAELGGDTGVRRYMERVAEFYKQEHTAEEFKKFERETPIDSVIYSVHFAEDVIEAATNRLNARVDVAMKDLGDVENRYADGRRLSDVDILFAGMMASRLRNSRSEADNEIAHRIDLLVSVAGTDTGQFTKAYDYIKKYISPEGMAESAIDEFVEERNKDNPVASARIDRAAKAGTKILSDIAGQEAAGAITDVANQKNAEFDDINTSATFVGPTTEDASGADAEYEIDVLYEQLDQMSDTLRGAYRMISSAQNAAQAEFLRAEDLATQVDRLKEQLSGQIGYTEALKRQVSELQKEVRVVNEQFNHLAAELRKAESKNDAALEEIDTLTRALTNVNAELQSWIERANEARAEAEAATSKKKSVKKATQQEGGKEPPQGPPEDVDTESEEEPPTPAEQLFQLMRNKVNSVEREKLENMIYHLYNKFLQTYPKKYKPKENPRALLLEMVKNREEYAEVWEEARGLMEEEFADDPAALDRLRKYFDELTDPVMANRYTDSVIRRAIRGMKSTMGVEAKHAFYAATSTADEFIANLKKQMPKGMSESEWEYISDYARKRFLQITREQRQKAIEAYKKYRGRNKGTKLTENQRLLKQLQDVVYKDGFNNEYVRNEWAKRLGLLYIDSAMQATIERTVREATVAETTEESDTILNTMKTEMKETAAAKLFEKVAAGDVLTQAQLLFVHIVNHVNRVKTPKERSAYSMMMGEMVKIFREKFPRARRVTNPFDVLAIMVANHSTMKEVWEAAREMVFEKFGEYPDLVEYYKRLSDPTMSNSLLDKIIQQAAASIGIQSKQVLARLFAGGQQGLNKFFAEVRKLMPESTTDEQFAYARKSISMRLQQRMRERSVQILERLASEDFLLSMRRKKRLSIESGQDAKFVDAMIDAYFARALAVPRQRELWARRFGLPYLDNSMVNMIYDATRELATMEDQDQISERLAELVTDLFARVPAGKTEKYLALIRSALLVTVPTLMRNASSNAIARPMQMIESRLLTAMQRKTLKKRPELLPVRTRKQGEKWLSKGDNKYYDMIAERITGDDPKAVRALERLIMRSSKRAIARQGQAERVLFRPTPGKHSKLYLSFMSGLEKYTKASLLLTSVGKISESGRLAKFNMPFLGDAMWFKKYLHENIINRLNARGIATPKNDSAEALQAFNERVDEVYSEVLLEAIEDAKEQTFRKSNALKDFVKSLGDSTETKNAARELALAGRYEEAKQKQKIAKLRELAAYTAVVFVVTPAALFQWGVKSSAINLLWSVGKLGWFEVGTKYMQTHAETINDTRLGRHFMHNITENTLQNIHENIARSAVGTSTFTLIGAILGFLGLLTGALPDSKTERKVWEELGKKPYSLYIEGLGSFPVSWLQPFAPNLIFGGMIGGMIAGEKALPNSAGDLLDIVYSSYARDTIVDNLLEPVGASSYGDVTPNIIRKTLTDGLFNLIPRVFYQVNRAIDPYERNIYKSGKNVELMRLFAQLPGASYLVPVKRDIWGQPIRKSAMPGLEGDKPYGLDLFGRAVNELISPVKVAQGTEDEITLEVLRVSSVTGDKDALPKIPAQKFEHTPKTGYGLKVDLSPDLWAEYQDRFGTVQRAAAEALINSPKWAGMNDVQKAEALRKAMDRARDFAKDEMFAYLVNEKGYDPRKNK